MHIKKKKECDKSTKTSANIVLDASIQQKWGGDRLASPPIITAKSILSNWFCFIASFNRLRFHQRWTQPCYDVALWRSVCLFYDILLLQVLLLYAAINTLTSANIAPLEGLCGWGRFVLNRWVMYLVLKKLSSSRRVKNNYERGHF